jgi:hypothetical protein
MSGLYANLLGTDTSSSATISKAPIVFANAKPTSSAGSPAGSGEEGAQKKINAGSHTHAPDSAFFDCLM